MRRRAEGGSIPAGGRGPASSGRRRRGRSGRGPRALPIRLAAAAGAAALAMTLLPARTLTVDDDGPAEFRLIQQAIDAAVAGDIVAVAAGTYRENLRLKSGVAVIGAGAPVTIVDGGRLASVARLVDCDAATRFEGFRLTGGQSDYGGGVRIDRGSPVIRFNEIAGNRAVLGGSYYGYGGGMAVLQSAAQISHNVLSGNEADWGGGLHLEGGSPRITRNLITGNTAGGAGGIDAYVHFGTYALIAANTIASNTALFGGGLELGSTGAPVVANNLILGNSAVASRADTGYGGGVEAYPFSNAQIVNNTLAGNAARIGGGAAIFSDGTPRLAGNIFLDNQASSAGGAADLESPRAAVLGNLFHLNGRGTCSGSSALLCSEPSNLEADPLLVDPAGQDFRPRAGSPAIDSAPADGAPADDVRGQRRPLDGDRDGIPAYDRGAYEFDRDAVVGLEVGPGPSGSTLLTWRPVSGASAYHVYSDAFAGRLDRLPGTCRDGEDDDPADRAFREPFDPPPGGLFAYLVTAVTAAGEGSPGFDSGGLERAPAGSCP